MKKYLLLLLLLPFYGRASQIVVGLRSDNLVSWNLWERQGNSLKHYLLLYNQGAAGTDVTIKLLRFASNGSQFTRIATNKTLHRAYLAPHQLVRLKYPASKSAHDCAEYFENGQSVGVLPISVSRPPASVLKSYRQFYSNQGANSGESSFWMAFESIYTPSRQIEFTAAHGFYPPDAMLKEEYLLVKLYPAFKGAYPPSGTLDSLAARADTTVFKFSDARRSAVLPVGAGLGAAGSLVMLAVYTEQVSDGYLYDEQKHLVPNKSVGGSIKFVPLFSQPPTRTRRRAAQR